MGVEIPAGIYGAIVLFISVSGALWAIWWRIEGKVKEARDDCAKKADAAHALAALARQELQEHRLEVAVTYATKQGMEAQTAQMMRALEGIAGRIDGLTERLDNILLQQRPSSRRSTT